MECDFYEKIISIFAVVILTFAMTACGTKTENTVTTDGSTSMEKVIGYLSEAYMEENSGLKVTYNPTGSGSGIQAVLEGRCDIGIKYNKESGLVDVIINTTDSKINLTVRDTGIGIPTSEQSRVFERFYRVDKSHSKLVGGTGLGLAIVKHGAVYHDAEIEIDSEVEKGTIIKIIFNNRK